MRTVKKISDLMRERNIELSQSKELLCGGKIDDNGKARINWKALQDEYINLFLCLFSLLYSSHVQPDFLSSCGIALGQLQKACYNL